MAVVAPIAAAALEVVIATEVLTNVVGMLVAQTISAALAPEFSQLQQVSWKYAINQTEIFGGLGLPLNTADLVDAVIKGHREIKHAQDDATRQGIVNSDFQTLVDSAGEPIPLLTAMEAWRRGFIPAKSSDPNAPSLEKAIRDSRLKNVWYDTVTKLQYQVAPQGTVIEAWLRAQLAEADAIRLSAYNGFDEATARLQFKAAGRPPSPEELMVLWRRGQIPESGTGGDTISVDQGYLETDLKDKWLPTWKLLKEYRPPARVVVALLRAGSITDAQALQMLKDEGLSDANAAIYVKDGHHQRSATTRELTKAEWVAMYVDQAITSDELTKRLLSLNYSAEDAALEVQLADLKVNHALEQRAVNRVGTLYTGRKIDKQTALTSLGSLKLPQAQQDRLLQIWSLERADNLRHLTPPEIAYMVKTGNWDEATALAELGNLGLGQRDAWVVLTYELKATLKTAMPSANLPPA